jgi:NDP-sugar pyrophosphorylase family protein
LSFSPNDIPLALLAGGLATRMKPITEKIPKSLIEVAGEPFIAHQLKLLKREGVNRVVICAGYLGEEIQNFVQDGSQFGLEVNYSFDGDKLLGTGGALLKAFPLLTDSFWVMYGDSYLDISFSSILDSFLPSGKPGLMTALHNDGKWDKSNALYENGYIVKYDKESTTPDMKYIDYGLGILKKSAFSKWKENNVFDLSEVFGNLVSQGELLGFEVKKRFYEIGSVQGLKETEEYIQRIRKQ